MITIKKYSNRRLYDTDESRYITLDELADKIQGGADARVVDAKSGEDLTQVTLAQIIVDGRKVANLLPVDLLTRLIRMQDEAVAEFFSKYITVSLDMYLAARRGARAAQPYFPFAAMPFDAANAFARMLSSHNPFSPGAAANSAPVPYTEPSPTPAPDAPAAPAPASDDIAMLRQEIEELRQAMQDKS